MNTKTIYTIITAASLFTATFANAHEPSKHAATKTKPNCEAMHKMDSSAMDMNDPVMQAMMKQCGKPDMANHHDKQDEKPACTEEHAKMGHCTLPLDKKPVCTEEHAKMGHCTLEADESKNAAEDSEPTDSKHKHD